MNILKYILLALQVLPGVVKAAKELQTTLPDGTGSTKLGMITGAVDIAYGVAKDIAPEIPHGQAIALVTGIVNNVVTTLKPLGVLGAAPQVAPKP